ncbi:methyltransferase domain-containing protein [Streptomyces sp. NPDC005963]|uniref:methyltransferase domain-containing protein n=1 Tax=Streptomyces sp. NPDC005963 TaxID=3156721 RepID=UPI0033C05657
MDPDQSLLALLDAADRAPGAARLRQRSYALLRCTAGARVVDVGCGGGVAVAELVGRGVTAVGLDRDPRLVAAARLRHPSCEFHVAGADALPFPDASLDGLRADRLLQLSTDPARSLGEARRVLAPGGRVVLTGQDWDLLTIDSRDTALTRTLLRAHPDRVPNPQAVRTYRNLLSEAGFDHITVEVHTAVHTVVEARPLATGSTQTTHDAGPGAWAPEQEAGGERDRFFPAVPIFVVAGSRRRP